MSEEAKTQTQTRTSKRHYSPSGGRASVTISGGVIAYVALALVLTQTLFLLALWNRYDLLRIYYNDIRTELIARGMNPNPHMPSESP